VPGAARSSSWSCLDLVGEPPPSERFLHQSRQANHDNDTHDIIVHCITTRVARYRVVSVLDSGAEGPRQTVHIHRASVHQAAKLVAAILRAARVTAGLEKSNGSLPPAIECGLHSPFYIKKHIMAIDNIRKQGSWLKKEIIQGTMPGARRRGRPRTAWMDNIVRPWCGQPSDRGRLKN